MGCPPRPAGRPLHDVLLADATARAKAAEQRRQAPAKGANHRGRRAADEERRLAAGLPPAPRGRPRKLRVRGSVVGTHVSDDWWLAGDWHPERNPLVAPETTPAGSGELVWWRCRDVPEHEWAASVRDGTLRGHGCRFCAGHAVARSKSLAITHPDIAAGWHPTRNGTKTPADFTYGSHFEGWWQCPRFKGHAWRARISSRTSMFSGCSLCARLSGKGGRLRHDAEANAVA